MFFPRPVQVLVVFVFLLIPVSTGWTQTEQAKQLAERVRTSSATVLVMNDLTVVRSDVVRLLNDAGFGALTSSVDEFFQFDAESCFSSASGAVLYWDAAMNRLMAEFVIANRDAIGAELDVSDNTVVRDKTWYKMVGDVPIPVLFDFFMEHAQGMVNGDQFLICENEFRAEAEKLLEAPMLAEKLDERGKQIINQSGLTLIGFNNDDLIENSFDLEPMLREYTDHLTEAELIWLREFSDVAVSAEFGLLGLKYHDSKVLEFRSQALIGDGKSFDKLLNLSNVDRDWRPALGLEPKQLVVAGSIQLDAFRSSAAPRAIPQLLIGEFANSDALRFLQGNMLRVLLELGGDSWNDLTAARLALYQNDESEGNGQLAIIGVVDARDVESVMTELRLLSHITNPMMAAERTDLRDEEIQRLVKDLFNDDANVSARAETRLRLVGPAAIPVLKGVVETADQRLRRRVERVLGALRREQDKAADRSAVADPRFWTTLNPGLELFESRGKVADFVLHAIEITQDPSKNEDEVNEATKAMTAAFGSTWNQVQVVQVRDHFIFMLGSDVKLLERIVRNVDAGASPLKSQFDGVGNGSQKGQLQFFFDSNRLMGLLDFRQAMNVDVIDGKVGWIGVNFDKHAISADALIPVLQIIPFVMLGMGN